MDQRLRDGYPSFPFVQLLAAVMIVSVLTAVAVPVYVGQRRRTAAEACRSNIATLARVETAYALRHGVYTAHPAGSTTALAPGAIGSPEGLAAPPTCPLDHKPYALSIDAAGALTIACPNAAQHTAASPTASGYTRTLAGAAAEPLP